MNNYALYYPTIEFSDQQWLWNASLLWDRIYRIVPADYQPSDPPQVRALMESGEIGIPLNPGKYAPEIAKEFMTRLESSEWNAAALVGEMPEEYRQLHTDKVDVALREMIISRGSGNAHGEWLHVPTDFAAHYMTYLANYMAEKNGLQMLSDSTPAWTGVTYFRYDGDLVEFPSDEYSQQLATLVVRDFLPSNVLAIDPEEILKFREEYRAERQRFLAAIQGWAKRLSECDDKGIAQDLIHDLGVDIESSLKEYRSSLSALRIAGVTGLKSLQFPVATKVATVIGGVDLGTTTLLIVSAMGVALGLVSGINDFRQKKRKLTKECEYSYLMHIRREWQGNAMYGHDYNYHLCRQMEEFIND